MTVSPHPPTRELRGFLLRARYMFCPSCGCETGLHDGVIRMGDEVIAHCSSGCGPCWKSAGTAFLETVVRRLGNEKGKGRGREAPLWVGLRLPLRTRKGV